jgi:putative component of membrane protein insertase Oxa1/YidC/SpoIIIJ protein YidD
MVLFPTSVSSWPFHFMQLQCLQFQIRTSLRKSSRFWDGCHGYQRSALQPQGPRTSAGKFKIVRYENRCEPVARVQSLDKVEDAIGGDFVQIAGRFVG